MEYLPFEHLIKKSIPMNWCISNNIGDSMNYWLANKITGKPVHFVPRESDQRKFICVGSILNWADSCSIVWGAGLANQTDTVNPDASILSTRGPVSTQIAKEHGAVVVFKEQYGDPALLASKYYRGRMGCRNTKVGLIPHYADLHAIQSVDHNFKIINVFDPIEKIVDEIKKCQVILSSSLHGLILADAYGVPNRHIKISDYVLGDGLKFYDYFLSVNRTYTLPVNFCRMVKYSESEIVKKVKDQYEPIDLKERQEAILYACPFV